MQLDVFPNPLIRARRAFAYVAVLQADIAALGRERIIGFPAAKVQIGPVSGRLMPIVRLGGREFVLLMPSMTNVPATELPAPIANLGAFRDRIVDAIDWVFLGV